MIERGNTMIMLMYQSRIVVPMTMRKKLLHREHLGHSGTTRISASIRAKYFWPGIEKHVKTLVEACETRQIHQSRQQREWIRPALGCVSCPMQAIGINFFERYGCKYLLLMDHFSGLPMYHNKGHRTTFQREQELQSEGLG